MFEKKNEEVFLIYKTARTRNCELWIRQVVDMKNKIRMQVKKLNNNATLMDLFSYLTSSTKISDGQQTCLDFISQNGLETYRQLLIAYKKDVAGSYVKTKA